MLHTSHDAAGSLHADKRATVDATTNHTEILDAQAKHQMLLMKDSRSKTGPTSTMASVSLCYFNTCFIAFGKKVLFILNRLTTIKLIYKYLDLNICFGNPHVITTSPVTTAGTTAASLKYLLKISGV